MAVQEEQLNTRKWGVPFPLALSMAGLFLLLSALFFIPLPTEFRTQFGSALLNTGHIVFFSLFAMAFYPFTKGKNRTRIPRFILLVFILSIAIEAIQSSVGRAFQWGDVYRNLLGAVLGISVLLHFQREHKPHWKLRIALFIAIGTAIIYERMPLLEKLFAMQTS